MPVLKCRTHGQLRNGADCDAFTKDDMSCSADQGQCENQSIMYTDEEIRLQEKVPLPPILEEIRRAQQERNQLFNKLTKNMSEEILQAYAIMDQVNPLIYEGDKQTQYKMVEAYWDNPAGIDRDMGILSALYARISATSAWAYSASLKSDHARSVIHSQKYTAIRKSYDLRLRSGKPTDTSIEHSCRLDPDYRSAYETQLDAEEQSRMVYGIMNAIDKHIQVLKKRIESLREERRNAGQT